MSDDREKSPEKNSQGTGKELSVEEAVDVLIQCGRLLGAVERLVKKAERAIRLSQIKVVK